ncbi:MAG TPA: DUF2911 domain-containing protein [Cyclobacteriaceae bacterium]|nr:DUF2911 domain-containing protein [Cyclobacteriaceae bacterium]
MQRRILILVLFLFPIEIFSQTQDTTKGSNPSTAELAIGKIRMRVNYYAPAVRGRVIWGGLVPYDQVWVTGAHSATSVEFAAPVSINGKVIKAGKYAIFTIPSKSEWTIIINKNWEQHLADDYSANDDVVRLNVPVRESGLHERLKYYLRQIDDSNAELTIAWEKIRVSFPIKLLSTKPSYRIPKTKSVGAVMQSMPGMKMMTHAFSKSLPMNRNGSGTGWLPDATPMYAWMNGKNSWSTMWHGSLFIRQDWQNVNNRQNSARQFDAIGWTMGMAQKSVGKNGLLLIRGMFSIDPITLGGNGYPLLFQTGESYNGQPLVNRQHPHDLVSELALGYTQRVNTNTDISLYLGMPGEPALGPTAFMHRISSINNPDAPLGHHWQDATHVTFGVATFGVRYKKFKAEASSFTGREPNENRFDFDKPLFDSYSYRLSYAPSQNFVLQASRAFIKSPESLDPTLNINRTTASLIYSKKRTGDKLLTASLVWGYNDEGGDHQEHSILAEGNYQLKKTAIYGRYEAIEKSSEELQLFSVIGDQILSIQSLTVGLNQTIATWFKTSVALGAQGTLSFIPDVLNTFYGRSPLSAQVYVRIIPQLMK